MSKKHHSFPDFTIEFVPKANYLVLLRQLMNFLAEYLGFDENEALQLEMCLDEACSNSINAIEETGDCSQKIRIEIEIGETSLRIVVIDAGKNFSHHFEKACPLTEDTDLTMRRGYGLKIIKTFMDEVQYIHHPGVGNQLHLTKYLSKE